MVARTKGAERDPKGQQQSVFQRIARARYVLRRVFRTIDECARRHDLDSLQHQALVQIFGATKTGLTVNELAERLDVTQPGASRVLKGLAEDGLIERQESKKDLRVTHVRITRAGRHKLHLIEDMVHHRVSDASAELTPEQQAEVLSLVRFYIGLNHWKDL
jgi:DNA-binding MarR family transcriptional regulator